MSEPRTKEAIQAQRAFEAGYTEERSPQNEPGDLRTVMFCSVCEKPVGLYCGVASDEHKAEEAAEGLKCVDMSQADVRKIEFPEKSCGCRDYAKMARELSAARAEAGRYRKAIEEHKDAFLPGESSPCDRNLWSALEEAAALPQPTTESR